MDKEQDEFRMKNNKFIRRKIRRNSNESDDDSDYDLPIGQKGGYKKMKLDSKFIEYYVTMEEMEKQIKNCDHKFIEVALCNDTDKLFQNVFNELV